MAALSCLACGGSETPPRIAETPGKSVSELHQGPLTDYVPAPTLQWLLLAEPARIARADVLEALAPLVDDGAWKRFEDRNGFDVRATSEAAVAKFEYGTLFLWRPGSEDELIERRFRERLLQDDSSKRPHPRLTSVRGLVGQTPQGFLRAQGQLVTLAVEDPTLVRVVEGYLLGRFRKTPSALRGAALRDDADFAEDAPLRFFMPAPADGQTFPPPLHVFSGAQAFLGAASFEEGPDATDGPIVRLRLAVSGPWEARETSTEPLEDAWHRVATSATGRLLHLDQPHTQPELRVVEGPGHTRLELQVNLSVRLFLQGLRQFLSAELEEIFPPAEAPGL